jgi:Chlorovirus glycoprotein repeat
MAIVQISKIQVRTGAESDLPQLDIGELGFATDTKNAYIGNDPLLDPPVGIQPTLTKLLTDSPNCYINASQLTGIINVDTGNIRITGGVNGYALTTDGTGNLSWSAMSGGGGGSVGGSNTQIQFNDSGTTNGVNKLTFNKSSNTLTVTGNLVTTNITGNITVSASSQPNITNVGTLISLTVANTGSTGNIISDNANLGNLVVANYFSGNGSLLTSVTATTAGTVTTNAQPNITSLGTLSSITIRNGIANLGNIANVKILGGGAGQVLTTDGSNNLSWATVSGSGSVYGDSNVTALLTNYLPSYTGSIAGLISNATYANYSNYAGNVTGGNVFGQVGNALISGTVYTAAQPNITSIGTLASLSVTGTVNAGNILATNIGNSTSVIYGNGRQLSSLAGANVTGTVANATYAISAGSAGTATTVDWTGISSTPSTINGYGITDAFGPILMAYNSITQSIPTGSSTMNLIYSTNSLSTSGYNNVTGIYTSTVAGWYQINATTGPVNGTFGSFFIGLYKNGSPYAEGTGMAIQSGWGQPGITSVSTLVYLNGTTDSINCKLISTSVTGSWSTISSGALYFQAAWLRP